MKEMKRSVAVDLEKKGGGEKQGEGEGEVKGD